MQDAGRNLKRVLFDRYRVHVPIRFIDGDLYAHLSVNIYVTVQDYTRLKDAILDLQNNWN